jgi:NAD(P)-dependent dehydrogenase (short-subunit alcohol dehydrogenase family)
VELVDRSIVITGGGSGIGAALARRCAAEGARGIVVSDLDAASAEAVAGELGAAIACSAMSPTTMPSAA